MSEITESAAEVETWSAASQVSSSKSGLPESVPDVRQILESDRVSNGVMNRAYAIPILDLLDRVAALEAAPKAAPKTSSPDMSKASGLNLAQTTVVIGELSILKERSHRVSVLAADSVAALHLKIDAAIATGNVSKDLLVELRDKLALLQEASILAMLCSNLLTRMDPSAADLSRGDLKPQVKA